jgi:phosphate transport system protein
LRFAHRFGVLTKGLHYNGATLRALGALARVQVRDALNAYRTGDVAQARRVWHGDDAVDRLHARLVATILETMGHTASPDALTTNTYVLWVSHNLERIADRASTICERVLFIATGDRWRRRAS